MKLSTILHIAAASTWYLALFSMFFTCFDPYTVLLIFRSRPEPSQTVPRFQERCVVEHAASPSCLATLQADPETWTQCKTNRGNRWTKICERPGRIKPLVKREKNVEELWRTIWMSIGSDSTQVAASPRCDPSMLQSTLWPVHVAASSRWVCTPKCQVENHHDMELTDSADLGDGYRCCAWNIVK